MKKTNAGWEGTDQLPEPASDDTINGYLDECLPTFAEGDVGPTDWTLSIIVALCLRVKSMQNKLRTVTTDDEENDLYIVRR